MPAAVHARLALARHGESEANAADIFTGWSDPPLTRRGRSQAKEIAGRLAACAFYPDRVFTSVLGRCRQTIGIVLAMMHRPQAKVCYSVDLNERDYGDLTGLGKAGAARRWGEEQVRCWRRSYTDAPPDGESLRDTAARVLAYYVRTVLPAALKGGSTIIVSHGNSLRALVMALDGMDAAAIERYDLLPGATLLYDFAADSSVVGRHVLA